MCIVCQITADAQPEQLEIAAPTSKKDALKKANRLPPPLVPAEIKQAVAGFQELFDPVLFPKVQNFLPFVKGIALVMHYLMTYSAGAKDQRGVSHDVARLP